MVDTYHLPQEQYPTAIQIDGTGLSNIASGILVAGIGESQLGGVAFQVDGLGLSDLRSEVQIDGNGQSNIFADVQVDGIGESSIGVASSPQVTTHRINGIGQSNIFSPIQIDGLGSFVMNHSSVQIDGLGQSDLRAGIQIDGFGESSIRTAIAIEGIGLGVIRETVFKFHIWYNLGSPPDLTVPANETFASLPFDTLAFSGAGVWYVVVREQNEFGLLSQNINAFKFELDVSDDEILERPSDVDACDLVATVGGGVLVTAEYGYIEDGEGLATGDKSADAFLVFKTEDGSDPDPDVDTPTVVAMRKSDGIALLSLEFTGIGDAITVKIIVQVRQTAGRDSLGEDIKTVVTSTGGPAAPVLTVKQEIVGKGVKIV